MFKMTINSSQIFMFQEAFLETCPDKRRGTSLFQLNMRWAELHPYLRMANWLFYVRYNFLLYVWLVLSINMTLRLVVHRTRNKWWQMESDRYMFDKLCIFLLQASSNYNICLPKLSRPKLCSCETSVALVHVKRFEWTWYYV